MEEDPLAGLFGFVFTMGLVSLVLMEVLGVSFIGLILICLSAISVLLLLITLIYCAAAYPETVAKILTSPIWFPHFLAAAILVDLSRCKPIRRLILQHHYQYQAIEIWWIYLPITVAIVWSALTWSLLAVFPWWSLSWSLPMTLIFLGLINLCVGGSTTLFLHFYYRLFKAIDLEPKEADWLIFKGFEKLLEVEHLHSSILRKADLKFQGLKPKR